MNNQDLFIKNINSKEQDRISVKKVVDEISKSAHRGCGLYHELYHSRLLNELRNHTEYLDAVDASKLKDYAASQGLYIDDESIRTAEEAEAACWREIRAQQE
ncbi:dpoa decarboxylase [Salmonella enterica]|nr:dpoa decarboxylase [Salmonella enterica]EEC7008034.1 dpoa decarboxylase [Salmonella enterica]